MSVSAHDIARILTEALPHMQRYDDEIVVVKYGGHAMGEFVGIQTRNATAAELRNNALVRQAYMGL